MLRITSSGAKSKQMWILCGQLAGRWVEEFRASWSQARDKAPESRFVIDLSDVTFIDEQGETVLRSMKAAGVEFIATGVDTRHLLQNLMKRHRPSLRRFMDSCAPDGKR